MIPAEDAEVFLQALGLESLDPFSQCKHGLCRTAKEEYGDNKRSVLLELACELNGIASPDSV